MPLADLLMERFKMRTRTVENPIVASVGTTATKILENNPNRLAWTIVNTHADQILYIALTNELTAATAVRLDAAGGSASEVWDEDFQEVGWAVWALGSDATTTIYVKEVVEY